MGTLKEGYREYKLDNGLVVALQNTPTKTITARLRVNYGSSHEQEGEEGMAHFLEHCLVTGGSKKYDPSTADKIRGSFGFSNAQTRIERTNFEGQMLSEDLESWLDYVSDHTLKPRFDEYRFNEERERVLREISDSKSSTIYSSRREFMDLIYRGHPKGRFVLGEEKVVNSANLSKIAEFHSRGYHPNNMDLIIAGGLPKNIKGIIEQYFGSALKGKDTRKKFPELNPLQDKRILHHPAPERYNPDNSENSSAYIFLESVCPPEDSKEEYALSSISKILGEDTNSLLFQNISLKKGLAYFIESGYNGEYNVGEFFIKAYIPASRIDEALEGIFKEINKMKTERVSNDVLNRIKKTVKYGITKVFESNEGHVSSIEIKLDKGITPESHIKKYDLVTPEKIIEVANQYLPDEDKGNYVLYIRDPLKSSQNQPAKP